MHQEILRFAQDDMALVAAIGRAKISVVDLKCHYPIGGPEAFAYPWTPW